MLLLVADENFNNDILRGLLCRNSSLDIVRIQDVGLVGAPDPEVLEWAAQEERVLLPTIKTQLQNLPINASLKESEACVCVLPFASF